MVDLQALVWESWEAALREARNSVVFLDDNAATTLRWNGGLNRLLKAGATRVKEFSAFESGEVSDSKALFIIAEDLQAPTVLSTLQTVLQASCFEACTIVSAMPIRPTPERTSQQEIQSLQRELREWMGSQETVSKVLYIPLVISCVLPRVAVLTPFTNLFPPLVGDEPKGQRLPPEQRLMLDQIVATISALLHQFSLKDQLFSLGKFAYTVADDLEQLPVTSQRRTALAAEAKKVSVIFVDRSIDVVLPLSFQKESVLDVMRDVLPTFDSTDVAINMEPVCSAICQRIRGGYSLARGSLSCLPQAEREELHNMKWKLVALHVKDEFCSLADWCGLTEQIQADDDPVKFVQRNLKIFRKSKAIDDSAHKLVELVGLAELLASPELEHRSEKLAVEKIFMQNATGNVLCGALDAGDAVVQLTQARSKARLSFTDLVGFLFYLHSLSGEEIYIEQRCRETVRTELLNALTEETLQDSSTWSPLAKILMPSLKSTETELHDAITKIEQAALRVSKQRTNLKHYRDILRKGDITSPATYKPLLRELFDDMKMGIESSDLEEHSSRLDGIGMLKGGLGFLMNVKTSRPNPVRDSDVVILVALGGITLTEIKLVEQVLADTNVQFLVITTSLLTPAETTCKVVSALVDSTPISGMFA